jgi:hypothetical protein
MQRTEPDVVCVVYSGDTDASKEQIIAKAKVRVRACCPYYFQAHVLTLLPAPVCVGTV